MPGYSLYGAPAATYPMKFQEPSHSDGFSHQSGMKGYGISACAYPPHGTGMDGRGAIYNQQAFGGVNAFGAGVDGVMGVYHPSNYYYPYNPCSMRAFGASDCTYASGASATQHAAARDLDCGPVPQASTDLFTDVQDICVDNSSKLQVQYAAAPGQEMNNLFLRGIPNGADDVAVIGIFEELGLQVKRSRMLRKHGNATCQALVEVASQEEAQQAIQALNNTSPRCFIDVKDTCGDSPSNLQVEYAQDPGQEWNNVFLKGVPNGADDVTVIGIFEELGFRVTRARILRKHDNATCQAMVEVASKEEASQAIQVLNDRPISDVFKNIGEKKAIPQHLLKLQSPLPLLERPTVQLAGSYVDGPRLAVRYKGNSGDAAPCNAVYIGNLLAGELDGPTVRSAFEARGYTVRSCTVVPDKAGYGFNSIVATLGSIEQTTLVVEELNGKSAQEFAGAMKNHAGKDYHYYCVVDFECTCDKINRKPHEIIEFPAIFVNAKTGQIEHEFHSYVRPTENNTLSEFCTELTGICQEQIDSAQPLHHVLEEFHAFCATRKLVPTRSPANDDERSFSLVTDGVADVVQFLRPECARKQIVLDIGVWGRIFNVRAAYHKCFNMKGGVKEMLEAAGWSFEGRAHSGIDDARNISRLVQRLVDARVDVSPDTYTGE